MSSANDRQVGGDHYRRHQQDGGEGHWDRIWRIYGPDVAHVYFVGNITKYVERYRDKNGIQDLEKARHYLDKLIELELAREARAVQEERVAPTQATTSYPVGEPPEREITVVYDGSSAANTIHFLRESKVEATSAVTFTPLCGATSEEFGLKLAAYWPNVTCTACQRLQGQDQAQLAKDIGELNDASLTPEVRPLCQRCGKPYDMEYMIKGQRVYCPECHDQTSPATYD